MSEASMLDQEELLHLAIEATQRGEHGAAISYLKEGIQRFPKDGKIAYVLGAEFAQIGLYDKAEEEMKRSIQLEPELYTAVFQLGLLQMTQGKVSEAKATWLALDVLNDDNALRLFKNGLESLAGEQYEDARILLEKGLVSNTFSPELNRDMQNVLSSIPSIQDAPQEGAVSAAGHAWLSAYNTDKSD